MSKWVEYNGSDEQINELRISCQNDGLIYRDKLINGKFSEQVAVQHTLEFLKHSVSPYQCLICKRHEYIHMIMQWARTGQPVWVKIGTELYWNKISGTFPHEWLSYIEPGFDIIVTNTPDWNIPGAEYSFKHFEDDVCGRVGT